MTRLEMVGGSPVACVGESRSHIADERRHRPHPQEGQWTKYYGDSRPRAVRSAMSLVKGGVVVARIAVKSLRAACLASLRA